MMDHGTAVEFRQNPKAALQYIKMAVATALVLAALGYSVSGRDGLFFFGGIGLLAIATSLFVYFRTRQDRFVGLRIDTFGLVAPGAGAEEHVAWSRISRIDFVRTQRRLLFMRVLLNGPADAAPPAKDLFVAAARAMLGAPIVVPIDDLEVEPQDIVAAVLRFSPTTQVDA